MRRLITLIAAAMAAGIAATPAAAQDEGGDKVNTVVVYGEDPCPASEGDTITVCARLEEGERYRIPEALRQSSDPANEAWASRVQSYETVGDAGPLSCSTIGLGSELGCTAQMIATAYEEKRTAPGIRAGELIAEARAERLATIDVEAAETQARVEELERQYLERVRQEDEGEVEPPAAPSGPVVVDPDDIAD